MELIFETYAGSHLYGTNLPTSDVDKRGIVYDPIDKLIGLQKFEQQEIEDEDTVHFGLTKFFQLAYQNNPNIIELLFISPNNEKCLFSNATWETIYHNRKIFLGANSIRKTFMGYGTGQIKRMETHHQWMTGAVPTKPDWADYGAREKINGGLSWPDNGKQNRYQADLKHYNQYQTWISNRNPARHELEEKYGFDTKHGMHLIRLYQEGLELLTTGDLVFPRPNADLLLEIRNGKYNYADLLEWAEQLEENIESVESILPNKPSYDLVNDLLINLNINRIIQFDAIGNSKWTNSKQ